MKKIFVSVPYSCDDKEVIEHRVKSAILYCAELLLNSNIPVCPVCPVIQGHEIGKYIIASGMTYDKWNTYALSFLDHAIDEMHVLTLNGHDTSLGVLAEISRATEYNIPFRYIIF